MSSWCQIVSIYMDCIWTNQQMKIYLFHHNDKSRKSREAYIILMMSNSFSSKNAYELIPFKIFFLSLAVYVRLYLCQSLCFHRKFFLVFVLSKVINKLHPWKIDEDYFEAQDHIRWHTAEYMLLYRGRHTSFSLNINLIFRVTYVTNSWILIA